MQEDPISEPEEKVTIHSVNHSKRSAVVWTLVGFLFVIIVLGAYFLGMRQRGVVHERVGVPSTTLTTPTPGLSASWISYKNDYGKEESVPMYSIAYPSDIFLRLNCPGEELILKKRDVSETQEVLDMPTCGRDGHFDIEVQTIKDTTQRPATSQYYTVTSEEVLVNGIHAKKYTTTLRGNPQGPSVAWQTDIYIPDGLYIHILHFEKPTYTELVDAMLKTFTLLHKKSTPLVAASPTVIPLDKKYTDKDYGYTISYPSPWLFRRTYGNDIPKQAPTDILSGIDLHNNTSDTVNIASIVVNVLDAHGLTDITDWITKYDLNYPKNGTKTLLTFHGVSAVKYVYSNNDRAYESLYFISGKYAYRMSYDETSSISDQTRDVVESFTP